MSADLNQLLKKKKIATELELLLEKEAKSQLQAKVEGSWKILGKPREWGVDVSPKAAEHKPQTSNRELENTSITDFAMSIWNYFVNIFNL